MWFFPTIKDSSFIIFPCVLCISLCVISVFVYPVPQTFITASCSDGLGSIPAPSQKWNLQKSACDEGVKIELRPVLAQFRANLSFPALKMLLSGL